METRRQSKILQFPFQNEDIKPWNSIRMQKVTGYRRSSQQNSIFSLSNRAQVEKNGHKKTAPSIAQRSRVKPNTAPENKSKRISMTNQLSKLGNISKEQIVGQNFQDDLQNFQVYSNFRSSVTQKKQLIFLRPHMKMMTKYNASKTRRLENSTEAMEKMKTEIYKNIKSSQRLENSIRMTSKSPESKNQIENASFIEYFTEYEGEATNRIRDDENYQHMGKLASYNNSTVYENKKSRRARHQSISVLREKLKNHFKDSKYISNIGKIKHGPGLPVTIIQ